MESEPQQYVFFAIDKSGSMASMTENGMTRVDFAMEMVKRFIDNTHIWKTSSIYGLSVFDNNTRILIDLSERATKPFDNAFRITPSGATAAFKTIDIIADKLIEATSEIKNVHKRIVLIGDGGDCIGGPVLMDMVKKLIDEHIIVDVFFLSNEVDNRIVNIAHLTGGIAVNMSSLEDVFESTAFINPSDREFGEPFKGAITNEMINNTHIVMDTEVKFKPVNHKDMILPKSAIKEFSTKAETSSTKEILKQIKIIAANQNPSFLVFFDKNDIKKWLAFIKAPEGSNYGDVYWELSIQFPENYPSECPSFRFITPPFHPNITTDGKICLYDLMEGYHPDKSIYNILEAIQSLLLKPNYLSPANEQKLLLYCCFNKNPIDTNEIEERMKRILPEIQISIQKNPFKSKDCVLEITKEAFELESMIKSDA